MDRMTGSGSAPRRRDTKRRTPTSTEGGVWTQASGGVPDRLREGAVINSNRQDTDFVAILWCVIR